MDDVIAAAIFVNAGARIESGWIDVGGCAVARSPNDHLAPLLRRAHFDPVGIVSIQPRLAQTNCLSNYEVRGNRRFPGSVRSGFHISHSLMILAYLKLEQTLSPESRKVQAARTSKCTAGCPACWGH